MYENQSQYDNNNPIEEETLPQNEEVAGVVLYRQTKTSQNGKGFCSIKVGNSFYTIWNAAEYSKFQIGDYIRGSYTRKYGAQGDFLTIDKIYSVTPNSNTRAQGQAPPQQQQMNSAAAVAQPKPQVFENRQVVQKPFQKVDTEAKYDLGMALNNAALIIAETAHDREDAVVQIESGVYDKLVEMLFIKNKTLRERFVQ